MVAAKQKSRSWTEAAAEKTVAPEDLEAQVAAWRAQGYSIATLNGSFDLLHAGHLQILWEASQQADKLLVGLNSDASIQKYKSQDRPIIPLRYRVEMMAALGFVDAVTWFEETDPIRFLSLVKPDVHVNGAEYGADCIEADAVRACGGRIHVVNLVPGLSTSQIVAKITSI